MKKLIKSAYKYFPLKKYLFILIRAVFALPKSITRHLYFIADFSIAVGDKSFKMRHHGYQFHVETETFWGGIENGWEKESMKIWMALCKDAKVILDIGANTGIFSLVAKTINPGAEIHAFEPLEKVMEKLEYNIRLNQFDIKVSKTALSNYSGKAVIR